MYVLPLHVVVGAVAVAVAVAVADADAYAAVADAVAVADAPVVAAIYIWYAKYVIIFFAVCFRFPFVLHAGDTRTYAEDARFLCASQRPAGDSPGPTVARELVQELAGPSAAASRCIADDITWEILFSKNVF